MRDRLYLQSAADAVKKELPDGHGFLLLTFPFNGEGGNRLHYVSNGNRADTIKMLKEFLFRVGESEDWMTHIK